MADVYRTLEVQPNEVRGRVFEAIVKHWLTTESSYGFVEAWNSTEAPAAIRLKLRMPRNDTKGVDLYAKDQAGKFYAIQCKYHQDPTENLQQSECEGLMAGMAYSGQFAGGIVTTTALRRSRNVAYELSYLHAGTWKDLSPEWFESLHAALRGQEPKAPEFRKARAHQDEASNKVVEALKNAARCQCLMACGTGKTLTAYFIGEKLDARVQVWGVPTLNLAKQHIESIDAQFRAKGVHPRYAGICSDKGVLAKRERDEFGGFVGTNIEEAVRWMEENKDGERVIVFTTYHSSTIFAKAARKAGLTPDLAVFDEAHVTVQNKDSAFATLLDDRKLPISKRVFFTATPRFYGGQNDAIRDMDDEEIYGRVAYKLSNAEAVRRRIIAPVDVYIVAATQKEVEKLVEERKPVFVKGINKNVRSDYLAGTVSLFGLMKKLKLGHVLSFHNKLLHARQFRALAQKIGGLSEEQTFMFSAADNSSERKEKLELFKAQPKGLASNVKVFTMGMDCPSLDAVAIIDHKQSKVDIQQAYGRVNRIDPDRPNLRKVVFVNAICDEKGEPIHKSALTIKKTLQALVEEDEMLRDLLRDADGKPVITGMGSVTIATMSGDNVTLDKVRKGVAAKMAEWFKTYTWEENFEAWLEFKQRHEGRKRRS
jgi:predicted helicase